MRFLCPGLGLGAHMGKKPKISDCYFRPQEFFVNLPVRRLTKKGQGLSPCPS
jgi:hypothetical protein